MNFAFIVDDREYAYDQIGKVCEVKARIMRVSFQRLPIHLWIHLKNWVLSSILSS